MARRSIDIVTFNENEKRAVDAFMDDLAESPSTWNRMGPNKLQSRPGRTMLLRHVPLDAQGNVAAAAMLAASYKRKHPATYVLFFGCAGACSPEDARSVFLVEGSMYLSLGTVRRTHDDDESVTLKNKWICDVDPPEVQPLSPIGFPLVMEGGAIDLPSLTGIPRAHVAATDKVVKVRPGRAPRPIRTLFGTSVWRKEDWSYQEAIAHAGERAPGSSLLVEMESFGVGALAKALGILDRVAIVRVTTDTLDNHGDSDSDQRALLMNARHALAIVVLALLDPMDPRLHNWRAK